MEQKNIQLRHVSLLNINLCNLGGDQLFPILNFYFEMYPASYNNYYKMFLDLKCIKEIQFLGRLNSYQHDVGQNKNQKDICSNYRCSRNINQPIIPVNLLANIFCGTSPSTYAPFSPCLLKACTNSAVICDVVVVSWVKEDSLCLLIPSSQVMLYSYLSMS